MTDIDAIARRWSADGGMGNPRGADDYTDAGCRIFAEHGFTDVAALLARVRELEATIERGRVGNVALIARVLDHHHAVHFATCNCGWRTDVPLGRSWRERHEFHQAEMVDAALAALTPPDPKEGP